MPSDPKELMFLAAKMNGLTGEGVKPWHLKATYRFFSANNKVSIEGTYEEFWGTETNYKRILTESACTQTDFGTEKGDYRVGSCQQIPIPISDLIRREFVTPLPSVETVSRSAFAIQPIGSKGTQPTCLRFVGLPDPGVVHCIAPDRPIVAINTYLYERVDAIQAIHDRVLDFHGRFIPGDVSLLFAGKPFLVAHLEDLRTLASLSDIESTPPTEAEKITPPISVPPEVAESMIIRKTNPGYPFTAKREHLTDTVSLQAVIGTDGHVSSLQVIGGPVDLRQPAINAVRSWTYRPYVVNGEAVEVNTTINVLFSLLRQ